MVRAFHLPVLRAMPDVEVRWICDQDLDRARTAAIDFGIGRAHRSLDQCDGAVDIVLVAIPTGARRAALQRIISNGWHALCEKPFAPAPKDHRWIIAEARAAKVRLGVGLVRRFYRSTILARSLIESGTLGSIERVIAGEGQRVHRTGRGADWYQASAEASGGGVLMESGPHLIDQMLTVCGVAGFTISRCLQKTQGGLDFETFAAGSLQVGTGGLAPFTLRVSRLNDVYNGIVIRCERGEVRMGLEVDSPVELRATDRVAPLRVTATEGPADLLSAFAAQWRQFISRCFSSCAFSDQDTGLLTTDFIAACYDLTRRPEERASAGD